MDIPIVNLFLDSNNSTINLKFQVIVIFLIILAIFTKFWNVQSAILIILSITIALYFVNNYINLNNNITDSFNKDTFIKLQQLQAKTYDHIKKQIELKNSGNIQITDNDKIIIINNNKLDSLYIDSTMIYFLFSILPLYDYNSAEFYLLLKGTNNILKIRKEIEEYYKINKKQIIPIVQPKISFKDPKIKSIEPIYLQNLAQRYEIAIQLKSNCVNNIQNIIYKVPKMTKMYEYIDNVIERYIVLINRNLKIIDNYHKESILDNGINVNTKFVNYYGTKSYDAMANQTIIPSKNFIGLQELYI